jgi:hypothetical protein
VSPGEEAVFFASTVCGEFKRRNDLSPVEGFRKKSAGVIRFFQSKFLPQMEVLGCSPCCGGFCRRTGESSGEEAVFFASTVCGEFKRRNDLSPADSGRPADLIFDFMREPG